MTDAASATGFCHACGTARVPNGLFCPTCGTAVVSTKPEVKLHEPKQKAGGFAAYIVLGVILLIGATVGILLFDLNRYNEAMDGQSVSAAPAAPSDPLADIHRQVAADAERAYNTAAQGNDMASRCVHAGLAAEAYLQAKDDDNYRRMHLREAVDCSKAGNSKRY